MKAALEGYRFVTPHVEFHDRMTLNFGGKTIELRAMKGVHSESDAAVWLPKERVVFSASAYVVNQVNILRPFVHHSGYPSRGAMIKGLNPETCRSGTWHAGYGEDYRRRQRLLRAPQAAGDALMKQGKSLDDIKKEVKMPEYASWGNQERMPTNIDGRLQGA
jgi:glyoxylase-like metal-dependent hydrolase (beta-lactamase superfamily II)